MSNFRAQQQSNQRKTFLLLGVMGSLTAFVIYAFALYLGYASIGVIPIAIGISVIGVWGSYYSSDKIVLSMTGAKVIDHDTAPQLFNLVHEITIASGLPMPKVAIVYDDAPNAFATWAMITPIGPAPAISTVLPLSIPAFCAAQIHTDMGSIRAAASKEMLSGMS